MDARLDILRVNVGIMNVAHECIDVHMHLCVHVQYIYVSTCVGM